MSYCSNCNQEVTDNYCSSCGQPKKMERINKHYIIHEIKHLLHLEKGYLYTVKEFFAQPGHSIRLYITKNRTKHIKPVPYLIFNSLLYTLVASFLHHNEFEEINKAYGNSSYVVVLTNWMQEHYGYSNIIIAVFVAFFIQRFFKKYNYTIYEITVVSLYIFSQIILVGSILKLVDVLRIVLFNLNESSILKPIFIVFQIVYATWAITQFFESKKVNYIIRAFLSYSIGIIVFTMTLVIIGFVLDMTLK